MDNITCLKSKSIEDLSRENIKKESHIKIIMNAKKQSDQFENFSLFYFPQKSYIPLIYAFGKKHGWDCIYTNQNGDLYFMEAKCWSKTAVDMIDNANKTIVKVNNNRQSEIDAVRKNIDSALKDNTINYSFPDNTTNTTKFNEINNLKNTLNRLDFIFGELVSGCKKLNIKNNEKIFSVCDIRKNVSVEKNVLIDKFKESKEILYVKLQ